MNDADDDRHYYIISIGNSKYVDATRKGNLGRFINHSCNPNCIPEIWHVNGQRCVGIFAKKDIRPGEEVTFDYQFQQMGKRNKNVIVENQIVVDILVLQRKRVQIKNQKLKRHQQRKKQRKKPRKNQRKNQRKKQRWKRKKKHQVRVIRKQQQLQIQGLQERKQK